jgi:hypothetical protein
VNQTLAPAEQTPSMRTVNLIVFEFTSFASGTLY